MDAFATKIVLRQIGLWCVLIAVVALLTLLFTVLGTLTCAVLTGMMMAASPHRRWQTVPVSAVFPGVVVAMVHAAKVELPGFRQLWLPALCFAAFWLTYFSTRVLIRFETSSASKSGGRMDGEPSNRHKPVLSDCPAPAPRPLSVEEIQGRWSCASAGSDGKSHAAVLEVAGDNISLSVVDPDGRVRLIASGAIRLKDQGVEAPHESRVH